MRSLVKTLSAIALFSAMGAAQAVSIFPNQITVTGKPGSIAPIQITVYGHPTAATIEFVKATDLKSLDDKVLTVFELGAEQRRVIPLDIRIPDTMETTGYYLCAVLQQSQAMRLRVCTSVKVIVKP
jgi:hypothetical protein